MDKLITDILKKLPHRFPFLLIDRVVDVEPFKRAQAIKNVSINEPFFTGHFPENPVMPGVMILEALAQCCGLLYMYSNETSYSSDGAVNYLTGIDGARFKQIVLPGDQLILDVTLVKTKRELWKLACEARVHENIVCSAELMIMRKEIKNDRQ